MPNLIGKMRTILWKPGFIVNFLNLFWETLTKVIETVNATKNHLILVSASRVDIVLFSNQSKQNLWICFNLCVHACSNFNCGYPKWSIIKILILSSPSNIIFVKNKSRTSDKNI